MIRKVKSAISDISFKRIQRSGRPMTPVNIKKAKTVGIIYKADEEGVSDLVKRFVKHLNTYPCKVSTLGYFSGKTLPHDVMPKLGFDYFCDAQIGWSLKPVGVEVENFIGEPFDILIDTSLVADKSIRFATVESQAKFKIGYSKLSYVDFLDLSIQLPGDVNHRELMKNIDRYLHLINK
jgi:hypothetical protein